MLAMKDKCERCEKPLPQDSDEAMICSFECSFCAPCAHGPLKDTCPNCGGEFQRRPSRIIKP